jgi:hypothetical protein
MNNVWKFSLAMAAAGAATAILSEPLLARGGAANIMNSPGYQRRLQESRQQQPEGVQQPSHVRSKRRHRH